MNGWPARASTSAGTPLFLVADVQMCEYADVQICGCADVRMINVQICECADMRMKKDRAHDGNLLFHGETKMGVFCIGMIFFDDFLLVFDTRLIAFRRRLIVFR